MNEVNESLSWSARFLSRLSNARFFTLSLLIHILLGTFLGTVVLFKVVREPEVFVASEAGSFIQPENEGAQEEESSPAEFTEAVAAPIEPKLSAASAIPAFTDVPSTFETSSQPNIQTAGLALTRDLGGIRGAPQKTETLSVPAAQGGGSGFFGVPLADGKIGLIGTFYDLKQTKDRKPTKMNSEEYAEVISDFTRNWNPGKLREYFQAPTILTSPYLFTPDLDARAAPKAFGVEKDVKPSLWVAWYRALVSPPKTGTYHFVGGGDDVMIVRFNGKLALDRCWNREMRSHKFEAKANYNYGFSGIHDGFAKGPAFRLKAGEFYEIDILIGERPGGRFFASLLIEDADVEYPKDSRGNPILPVFRVANEAVEQPGGLSLPPYEKAGPVWHVRPPLPNEKAK